MNYTNRWQNASVFINNVLIRSTPTIEFHWSKRRRGCCMLLIVHAAYVHRMDEWQTITTIANLNHSINSHKYAQIGKPKQVYCWPRWASPCSRSPSLSLERGNINVPKTTINGHNAIYRSAYYRFQYLQCEWKLQIGLFIGQIGPFANVAAQMIT